MNAYHTPVMVTESVAALRVTPGKWYIDATLGGGGHAGAILDAGGNVLGLDLDRDAVAHATDKLSERGSADRDGNRWIIRQGSYADMDRISAECGISSVAGVIFDLGVSGYQLDNEDKGFGFVHDEALLDMRFDVGTEVRAADKINQSPKEELYEILSAYGEEKYFRPITDAIVRTRSIENILNVRQLKEVINRTVGKNPDIYGIYARVFQALRIAVNHELGTVKSGLGKAESILQTNGVMAVISYHSLEDRIVKLFLQNGKWHLTVKKPILPDISEIRENKRARSAKLRYGIKI